MYSNLLLPTKFKKAGWIMLIAGLSLGILLHFNSFVYQFFNMPWPSLFSEDEKSILVLAPNNIADELASILLICSILCLGFSREPNEDDGIAALRRESLIWAVVINYLLLLFAVIFIRELLFLKILAYNMFTVGLVYVGRFNYFLYVKYPVKNHEKLN